MQSVNFGYGHRIKAKSCQVLAERLFLRVRLLRIDKRLGIGRFAHQQSRTAIKDAYAGRHAGKSHQTEIAEFVDQRFKRQRLRQRLKCLSGRRSAPLHRVVVEFQVTLELFFPDTQTAVFERIENAEHQKRQLVFNIGTYTAFAMPLQHADGGTRTHARRVQIGVRGYRVRAQEPERFRHSLLLAYLRGIKHRTEIQTLLSAVVLCASISSHCCHPKAHRAHPPPLADNQNTRRYVFPFRPMRTVRSLRAQKRKRRRQLRPKP